MRLVATFALALQASVFIGSRPKSNTGWLRAQFVPNTAHDCGHSRLFRVNLFLAGIEKP
jgi:hypothetical protein